MHFTTAANARYFAFSIGQKDIEMTRKWFNSALSISLLLPSILLIVGLIAGEYVIRIFSVNPGWTLVDVVMGVSYFFVDGIYYDAVRSISGDVYSQTEYRRIIYMGNGHIGDNIFICILSVKYPGNKWLIYSIGISSITSLFTIIQAIRAARKYSECKIVFSYWFNGARIKEMFSYSFWTLFGGLGGLLYHNGLAIVLNKFFSSVIVSVG